MLMLVYTWIGSAGQYKGDTSPLRYLEMAAEGFSTAIKLKPKDGKFHFSLGQVLEEQFYCEDLYGIKPQVLNSPQLIIKMCAIFWYHIILIVTFQVKCYIFIILADKIYNILICSNLNYCTLKNSYSCSQIA